MDEFEEGTPRSSRERSGVCFGGFRHPKQVEEPRVLARGAPLLGLGGEGMGSPKPGIELSAPGFCFFAGFQFEFFSIRYALLVLRSRNYCVGGCLPAEVKISNVGGRLTLFTMPLRGRGRIPK